MFGHLKIQQRPGVKPSACQGNFWTKSVDFGEVFQSGCSKNLKEKWEIFIHEWDGQKRDGGVTNKYIAHNELLSPFSIMCGRNKCSVQLVVSILS